VLDPVYTGKALHGVVDELRRDPGRFGGGPIAFVHTGGIYGLLAAAETVAAVL
jgi:1-aminocyclopropane-1-carboxylate deaminase/D-cysteine desulfhydrase-like pyridoxal-dependent ACC family enzyme